VADRQLSAGAATLDARPRSLRVAAERQARIFYFSGTGNAALVARWAAGTMQDAGMTATTVNIAGMDRPSLEPPGPDVLLGFVSPTHGFNVPPITMHFLFAFPRSRHRNRVFLMNTRAGMKLGRLFLPGLSGVALLLAAVVLLAKGYRIAGMRPIDMPSNWLSLHPSLRPGAVVAIAGRCEAIVKRFATRLISGGTDFRALLDLPQDLLIAPVGLLYYAIGRFALAKSFYASAACNNCGTCAARCPVKAIATVQGRPFWTFRCESCMRCMNECPTRAIETGHGYIAGLIVLVYLVVADRTWAALPGTSALAAAGPLAWWVRFAFDNVILLGSLAVTYRLIHVVGTLPGVQRLLVATSLTAYTFWGRYRLTKILRRAKADAR
jgi:Pyruvate/2-oxoacid:ferredoxin oxidoreductase delta subunit